MARFREHDIVPTYREDGIPLPDDVERKIDLGRRPNRTDSGRDYRHATWGISLSPACIRR